MTDVDKVIEDVAAKVHEEWMANKEKQGVSSRKSESGEELMVPYTMLSEEAKELDRGSVKATLQGLAAAGYVVTEAIA